VTVTATPTWHHGFYYRPGQCRNCQTVTYKDAQGSAVTIAVPTNPWATTATPIANVKPVDHPTGKHW
jgi:hypothetical protein